MRLEIRDLVFRYGMQADILKGVSLTYDSPETLCILGANGTGKSTLLKCITGENRMHAGEIVLDGRPLHSYRAKERARAFAYIAQSHVPSFPFSVLDIVTMGRTARMGYFMTPGEAERETAMENLRFLRINHLAEKPYTEISGGERQLVMIASALTQEPEMLLLDEPTAHLDFGNAFRFLELVERLRERKTGVLMTTHFPDHALYLNCKTAILQDGQIAACGKATDVVTAENLTKLYGLPIALTKVGERLLAYPEGTAGDGSGD